MHVEEYLDVLVSMMERRLRTKSKFSRIDIDVVVRAVIVTAQIPAFLVFKRKSYVTSAVRQASPSILDSTQWITGSGKKSVRFMMTPKATFVRENLSFNLVTFKSIKC